MISVRLDQKKNEILLLWDGLPSGRPLTDVNAEFKREMDFLKAGLSKLGIKPKEDNNGLYVGVAEVRNFDELLAVLNRNMSTPSHPIFSTTQEKLSYKFIKQVPIEKEEQYDQLRKVHKKAPEDRATSAKMEDLKVPSDKLIEAAISAAQAEKTPTIK